MLSSSSSQSSQQQTPAEQLWAEVQHADGWLVSSVRRHGRQGVGQRRVSFRRQQRLGSDTDLTSSPSDFHKRAAPPVGRRVSSRRPSPASAASSASSTDATPPFPHASDDPDFNDADNAQYRAFLSKLARWKARTARDRSGRWRRCSHCAGQGLVPLGGSRDHVHSHRQDAHSCCVPVPPPAVPGGAGHSG